MGRMIIFLANDTNFNVHTIMYIVALYRLHKWYGIHVLVHAL